MMQCLEFFFRQFLAAISSKTEHVLCTLEQLLLPLGNLVRVHIEALCQLGQGLPALQSFQRCFRLQLGGVISTWSSQGVLLLSLAIIMVVHQGAFHLWPCLNYRDHF